MLGLFGTFANASPCQILLLYRHRSVNIIERKTLFNIAAIDFKIVSQQIREQTRPLHIIRF